MTAHSLLHLSRPGQESPPLLEALDPSSYGTSHCASSSFLAHPLTFPTRLPLSQCSSPGLDRSFYLSRPKTHGVYFYQQICSTTTPSLRVLSVSGEQHSLTSSSDRTRLILFVFSSPQVEVLQRRSQEGLSCSRPRSIFLRASGSCISFLVPRRQI